MNAEHCYRPNDDNPLDIAQAVGRVGEWYYRPPSDLEGRPQTDAVTPQHRTAIGGTAGADGKDALQDHYPAHHALAEERGLTTHTHARPPGSADGG